MVGIFGVVSYVAAQRTREIGVRMALGAQRREILELVVGQGMRPIVAGICAGVVGAVALTRFIANAAVWCRAAGSADFRHRHRLVDGGGARRLLDSRATRHARGSTDGASGGVRQETGDWRQGENR